MLFFPLTGENRVATSHDDARPILTATFKTRKLVDWRFRERVRTYLGRDRRPHTATADGN